MAHANDTLIHFLFGDVFTRPFPTLLWQLAVVVAAAGLCGRISRRLGQPSVIGEMAAGILLGPSLLGHFLPGLEAVLFPPASLGNLNLLSQVGIILFMFSVGMEIDLGALRKHAKTALFVPVFLDADLPGVPRRRTKTWCESSTSFWREARRR